MKFNYYNFDKWIPYEGFAEGSGRSEKIWLKSPVGMIGLFKFPKVNPSNNEITTEHISEHIASQIGKIIEVDTAKVDLGYYNNKKGCMSYLINKSNEIIVEGSTFISGLHPDYNIDEMVEKSTGRYYCIEHIFETDLKFISNWLKMMLFDYIIGNTDRHQNNWAYLYKFMIDEYNQKHSWKNTCPLYDNGSSLCSYITDELAKEYLGKDKKRFDSLVDSKSKSMIRFDGSVKDRPTHKNLIKFLLNSYIETKNIANEFIIKLNNKAIVELLDNYSEVLSDLKLQLIKKFLMRKIEILSEIVKGD